MVFCRAPCNHFFQDVSFNIIYYNINHLSLHQQRYHLPWNEIIAIYKKILALSPEKQNKAKNFKLKRE